MAIDSEKSVPVPAAVAIIPAFNEQGRVGAVVTCALASGLFAEVLVVDDGSTDETSIDAARAGAQVIRLDRNLGKPAAMQAGLAHSEQRFVCFLDADLLKIDPGHLRALVEPVTSGQCASALAVFRSGRAATSLAQRIAPMISGQRCLRRDILAGFSHWDSGFGIETALNDFLRNNGIVQRIVHWEGASHVMKEEKRGFWRGLIARLRMYWEILRTWTGSKRRR